MEQGPAKHTDERLNHLLHRVVRRLRRGVEQELAPHGVTRSQYWCLFRLYHNKADTPSKIGRMANVDYGAVTRMLDRLEEKKMLVRKAHGEDRRSVRLEITPEGRRMVDLLQPIVANWMRKYFSPLNESEKESFARAMVALIEADSGQNESDM